MAEPAPVADPVDPAPVADPKPAVVVPDPAPAAEPTWLEAAPENWREIIAGEDKARGNQLARVSTPQQLMDNYFAAQEKIRSGAIAAEAAPADDAPDDDWAEYRSTRGIPAKPDEYKLSLRTAARLEKRRLKGKAIYTYLYGEKDKKPYRKEN